MSISGPLSTRCRWLVFLHCYGRPYMDILHQRIIETRIHSMHFHQTILSNFRIRINWSSLMFLRRQGCHFGWYLETRVHKKFQLTCTAKGSPNYDVGSKIDNAVICHPLLSSSWQRVSSHRCLNQEQIYRLSLEIFRSPSKKVATLHQSNTSTFRIRKSGLVDNSLKW